MTDNDTGEETMDPKGLMAVARQYAPLLALVAGLSGGSMGMKFWDQEQMDRMEQREIAAFDRLGDISETLQRFHGQLDACRGYTPWPNMPAGYYTGREVEAERQEKTATKETPGAEDPPPGN